MRHIATYIAALLVALLVVGTASARSVRYHHWIAPAWWLRGAHCIHMHESRAWHHKWTLYGSTYANGFSMLLSTWERAGGQARTWYSASPHQQYYRAYRIWRMDGGSWREWSTRNECGLS